MHMTPIALEICIQCQHRQRPCSGRCVCKADDRGEDIEVKAAAKSCPMGYHRPGAVVPVARPLLRGVGEAQQAGAITPTARRRPIREAGPELWAKWHSHPTGSPELLAEVLAELPSCGCLAPFNKVLQRLPPVYGPGWFRRTWEWHEAVNAELGVTGMSFADAAVRYGRLDLIEQPTKAV